MVNLSRESTNENTGKSKMVSLSRELITNENIGKAHEQEEWYHGLLPREDITRLLKHDGQFIVRSTQPFAGQAFMHVLSVKWKEKHHHFVIYERKGQVVIDKHAAGSIYELINDLLDKKKVINDRIGAILLHPVPKQDWELNHEQITLGKMLGEGAFGGVYCGIMVQGQEKIKVAVKVNKGKEASKKVIDEICKEARIMRRYQHPNVVKFYGVCVAREPIMLVMEMVDGGALDSHLQKNNADMSVFDRLRYATGAAKGLEYLHRKDCIHRDVASRNCLVHETEVKISDFGLSRELSNRAAKYKLKDMKQRLPIRWLAPEVLNSATYSSKSDVYSFGVLLWEIFANAAIPYAELTLAEVNVQVRAGLRLKPPMIMPKFVREVMINYCFPANPDLRWTMKEIRIHLDNVVEKRVSSIYQTLP